MERKGKPHFPKMLNVNKCIHFFFQAKKNKERKNVVYNTFNIQSMCYSTVYAIGQASSQQRAVSS